jgi:hypothetical protein
MINLIETGGMKCSKININFKFLEIFETARSKNTQSSLIERNFIKIR